MSASYGLLVGRGQVEAAAVQTLQLYIETYLGEVERVLGLPTQTIPLPPDLSYGTPTSSIHGGMDFETWTTGQSPEIIVVVRPDGDAVKLDQNTVRQDWMLSVGVAAVAEDENSTRLLADWYGTAIMECVVQQGSANGESPLGQIANWVNLTEAPDAAFLDEDRRVIVETVTFIACVIPVVQVNTGPSAPAADPYAVPGSGPVVQTYTLDLTADEDL